MQTLPRISLDSIFTAIGHAKRRGIIESLSFRPATVSQLAEEHAISLPGIHKHIRILEDAQLIQRSGLKEMQAWVRQFHPYWGNDRETLENYIEKFTS
jgi:predicted transcriptional regulator